MMYMYYYLEFKFNFLFELESNQNVYGVMYIVLLLCIISLFFVIMDYVYILVIKEMGEVFFYFVFKVRECKSYFSIIDGEGMLD